MKMDIKQTCFNCRQRIASHYLQSEETGNVLFSCSKCKPGLLQARTGVKCILCRLRTAEYIFGKAVLCDECAFNRKDLDSSSKPSSKKSKSSKKKEEDSFFEEEVFDFKDDDELEDIEEEDEVEFEVEEKETKKEITIEDLLNAIIEALTVLKKSLK